MTLPPPPPALLDGASLFMDFDGTLVDLADRPDMVAVDETLRTLVALLHERHAGRIAIVSGRSIAQLDALLGPLTQRIALSGSHGCEHRWDGISAHPVPPPELETAAKRMKAFAKGHPGTLVEEKSFGVALHYRMAPQAEAAAQALGAELAAELGLSLQQGKMVVELRPPGGSKGGAVRRLMSRPPMAGTRPIFLGDDVTDEDGFEAVLELGGTGILIGPPRPTAARYRLPDPASARAWLGEAPQ
ncbi:trehalose-phosphatase [Sphingomonas sp. dw_22]|uniref:trehalose-phosphatase n=1 Tax=Sphingomonas sp. dw_22 TaxID=2721175 RepID=UPI001BD5654D|nr:trehalose-phosphatase [Sphingomonas sp. dw_22]